MARWGACLACVALALLVAPAISQATLYQGETGQGKRAGVRAAPDGQNPKIKIGGPRAAGVSVSAGAMRRPSRRPTFRAGVVVRRRGRVIDKCRMRRTRWSATVPGAAFDMTSDNDEYIGQGGSYSFQTPFDSLIVSGDRRSVAATAGGFTLEVEAPTGSDLSPGRYTGAKRAAFNDDAPGLEVSGNGGDATRSPASSPSTRRRSIGAETCARSASPSSIAARAGRKPCAAR